MTNYVRHLEADDEVLSAPLSFIPSSAYSGQPQDPDYWFFTADGRFGSNDLRGLAMIPHGTSGSLSYSCAGAETPVTTAWDGNPVQIIQWGCAQGDEHASDLMVPATAVKKIDLDLVYDTQHCAGDVAPEDRGDIYLEIHLHLHQAEVGDF